MISVENRRCPSDAYNLFYEAAHNNEMDKVRRYVEDYGCCPNVDSGTYGHDALWVAGSRGNVDVVAYLESVLCGKNVNKYGMDLIFMAKLKTLKYI